MEIKNETVYVIYFNGTPFKSRGRKIVYTKLGSARGVITKEAESIAIGKYTGYWWNLNYEDREKLVEEVKQHFSVIEYKPIKDSV